MATVTILGAPANAITPPDSCFQFDSGTGTITSYYDHEANNPVNPTCPKAVDIPSTINGTTVTAIGQYAFTSKQLTSVAIPNGVTVIGQHAFQNNQLTSVTIPDGVATIETSVFSENQLSSVNIPTSVTAIGVGAFSNNQLTSVDLPDGLTILGGYAFRNNQLTSIDLPDGLTAIETHAFYRNRLTSVVIPDGITTIGSYAFERNALTNITIPSGVTSIGEYAFNANLITQATLLGSPTGDRTVLGFNPLSSISYDGTVYNITSSATTPSDACFDFNATTGEINHYKLYDLTLLQSGVACVHRNIIVPGSIGGITVTSAGWQLSSIGLEGVAFPNTILSEPSVSFNNLTSLTLPSGLTALSSWTYNFNSLTRITIPSGVTEIDPSTFFAQSPWGGSKYFGPNMDIKIYSSDPTVYQHVLDNLWYIRAYTEDPDNPFKLTDSAVSEAEEIGADSNLNENLAESVGGHIINPASTTVRYQDTSGAPIAPDVVVTGLKSGAAESSSLDSNDYLHTYLVTESAIQAPLDPYNPSPEELEIMQTGFDQYYRIGDSVTFRPKDIAGYSTPSAQTAVLSEEDNVITFVYSTPSGDSDQRSISFSSTTSPAGTHPLLASSTLKLGEGNCTTIQSASLLSPESINATNKPSDVHLLGGIDFTLLCPSADPSNVSFELDGHINNISKLRAYKYDSASRQLTDITHLVTVSSQTIDNRVKTIINYGISDGGVLDEDGIVNGSVKDPLVIGYMGNLSEISESESLASTGMSIWSLLAMGVFAIVGSGKLLRITLNLK